MHRTTCPRKTNSTLFSVLFVLVLQLLIACSPSTRSLFFDIPASKPKPEPVESIKQEEPTTTDPFDLSNRTGQETERPAIEKVTSWEEAFEMLPKDYKKQADWSAALNQGLVRPRFGASTDPESARAFKYDFIIPAENPKNEGYFPHSSHVAWLSCQNCHISLYPYKRNPAKMRDMRNGASCGACHGKVAFSLRQCKRCHLKR